MKLPDTVETILVTRLDSLGDIVLSTLLFEGLHARWPEAQVKLLVRPQMSGVSGILPDWVTVHTLPFDPRESVAGIEVQLAEQLQQMVAELSADVVVLGEYNRVWAGEILGRLCGSTVIGFEVPSGLNVNHRPLCALLNVDQNSPVQTVQVHGEDREPIKYLAMLTAMGIDATDLSPTIVLRDDDRRQADQLWSRTGVHPSSAIVCFASSGDRLVRSLDADQWVRWIAHLRLSRPVVLLGSEFDDLVLEEMVAAGLPDDVPKVCVSSKQVGVMGAFLERAAAYVGMDTGPMHVAAVLGKPTLGAFGGGHRAHRFLPVGPHAAAVRMPISCYGCDWRCPFDRRHCIKDIPEQALHEAGDAFLQSPPNNASLLSIQLFDLLPPPHLPVVVMGSIMRQHNRFLDSHHRTLEHLAYLNEQLTHTADRLAEVSTQNHLLQLAISEMTEHNTGRDRAIAQISQTLAEMSTHNGSRDEALAHIGQTLAEFTRQNEARDQAIAHINDTLAAMTVQNNARDQAISALAGGRAVR